jgi:RNase P subunit RPR2
MARRRNKGEERAVARSRIDALLAVARAERLAHPGSPLPHRHGTLALRIAQKYQSGLAPHQKAQLCRKCGAFRGADASRTRVRPGHVATTCLKCGHISRRNIP